MNRRPPLLPVFLALAALGAAPLRSQTGGEPGAPRPDALQSYRAGRDLEALNRMPEAEAHYNEAVRICSGEIAENRGTGDSYAVLAWALQRQKKYGEVIRWGEQGLRLFPDDYRIIEIMGEAYFYLNNYDSSLLFMQRYVNALPQGDRASTAYFFIGEIFRIRQKFLHADIAYTTAVRLEPGLPLWWYRLGSVREAAGDYAPAGEAYERALRLNPGYPEAGAGLARVRRPPG
jgi:tetratricopeptide (TPR) repeat protein